MRNTETGFDPMVQQPRCEASVKPNQPPAVLVRHVTYPDGESPEIIMDPRTTDYQHSFVHRRGMDLPDEVPNLVRGYVILQAQPVLIIAASFPEESVWLMVEWNDCSGSAGKVILAVGAEDKESLLARRIKLAADDAVRIHRVFFE